MKTDELISLLAADTAPVPRGATARRMSLALAAGLPVSAAIVGGLYHFRPDLGAAMHLPMFWFKLLFGVAMAAAGFAALLRLGRPGVPLGRRWAWIVAPVLVVWILAAVVLAGAPGGERTALVLGETWRSCTASIAFISLPVFIAALRALATLAPTQPRWAGACAGAMAGGAAAAVYAFHCPELEAPFLAVWYVLGMAVPLAVGAWIGPRVLRW
jgi:hypothetical protein